MKVLLSHHDLSEEDLGALRTKYEAMLALRTAHVRAREDATFVEPDPRPAMARLADEFPGALREIDTLPLEVIVTRIERLAQAERDRAQVEPWMHAQALFHRLARGALVAKRWLATRKLITPTVQSAFTKALDGLPRGADAGLFVDDLARIAEPPRGRVMDLVHAKVAEILGITEAEARALVFGPPRTRSHARD